MGADPLGRLRDWPVARRPVRSTGSSCSTTIPATSCSSSALSRGAFTARSAAGFVRNAVHPTAGTRRPRRRGVRAIPRQGQRQETPRRRGDALPAVVFAPDPHSVHRSLGHSGRAGRSARRAAAGQCVQPALPVPRHGIELDGGRRIPGARDRRKTGTVQADDLEETTPMRPTLSRSNRCGSRGFIQTSEGAIRTTGSAICLSPGCSIVPAVAGWH